MKNKILALILALCGIFFALYYAFLSLRAVFLTTLISLEKESAFSLK